MDQMSRLFGSNSWRVWPVLALILAGVFVAWDMVLVSGVQQVQSRVSAQLYLLDELDGLNRGIHQLELTHRVDAKTGRSHWVNEKRALGGQLEHLAEYNKDVPGMEELVEGIRRIIHKADSIHRNSYRLPAKSDAEAMNDAVLAIVLSRSDDLLNKASQRIRREDLDVGTAALSERWDRAQELLLFACLLAILFAILVGTHRRLLDKSRNQAAQLQKAKEALELTNKELRETMLSKEEKEVMIKEIHHRVKNNLQIVKSLIRFQMDQVSDEQFQELLRECVNRVSAMALVHEQTYLSKDLANIDVTSYLEQLIRDLVYAYNIDTELKMDLRISVPTLDVDTLIPLGLLINEVISNSFKYAFKGRSKGTVLVHLSKVDGSGLHLVIGDDGSGLPDKMSWEKPKSLGMELIHTLTEQLDGQIVLLDGPGTCYDLRQMPKAHLMRA